MKIQAMVIDGFHKGHVLTLPYSPVIKLLKPKVVMVDTCCDGSEYPDDGPEVLEYKACFHALDKRVVLYSGKGDSFPIFELFPHNYAEKPWLRTTELYFGYHDGFLRREDHDGVWPRLQPA